MGGGDDSYEFIMHHLRWQLDIWSIFPSPARTSLTPAADNIQNGQREEGEGRGRERMLLQVPKWLKKMDKGKVLW